jgi:hypothetical protein
MPVKSSQPVLCPRHGGKAAKASERPDRAVPLRSHALKCLKMKEGSTLNVKFSI